MALAPFREAVDAVALAGGEALKQCYQCGLCTGTCPWNLIRHFPVRKLIHEAQMGLVDFEAEETWSCATCRACVARCPRGVAIIDIMRALRNIVAEMGAGHLPDSLRVTMKNIAGTGNPLGEPADRRTDWINDGHLSTFAEDAEVLYFSCCIPAYDPNLRRVARATANIFHRAGVRFALTGSRENCCGESVRKSGNETLFQKLAANNIAAFSEIGAHKIVVTSPHCYYTFKNEYPALGGQFEVLHYTEFMAQLIQEGRLKPTRALDLKVTYHDPCYLGRHSGIYDAPRTILKSIPGLQLIEMNDSGPDSICCGGGGGRIWMETRKGERLSDFRLDQAAETGATMLAAACPYCILNFEDSILTSDRLGQIEVKDISEILAESL